MSASQENGDNVVVELKVEVVVVVDVVLVLEVVLVVGGLYTPPSWIDHQKVSIIYVLAGSPTVELYLEYLASNGTPD